MYKNQGRPKRGTPGFIHLRKAQRCFSPGKAAEYFLFPEMFGQIPGTLPTLFLWEDAEFHQNFCLSKGGK